MKRMKRQLVNNPPQWDTAFAVPFLENRQGTKGVEIQIGPATI
jgi:hypothetical protein